MDNKARVIKQYRRQYPNPIEVRTGQRVDVGREDTEFPGWKWCKAPDGREGWIPIELLSPEGPSSAVLAEDYSALELTVDAGEELTIEAERHGWLLVRNSQGQRGWIPASHVAPITPAGHRRE